MERTSPTSAPRDEEPSEPRIVVSKPRGRDRVREALRCPYCHDQVDRSDVLACARRGCGALYHRECWGECARYDGCAALGCGSRDSREVTALGYLVRVLRLVLAALLFPRRVVRAMQERRALGATSLFREALGHAWKVVPGQYNGLLKSAYVLGLVVPLTIALGWTKAMLALPDPIYITAMVVLAIALGGFVLPLSVALIATLAFLALRALGRAFVGELAALARGDAPVVRAPRVDPKKDLA